MEKYLQQKRKLTDNTLKSSGEILNPIPATNHNTPDARLGRRRRINIRQAFYNAAGGVLWLAFTAKSHKSKFQLWCRSQKL